MPEPVELIIGTATAYWLSRGLHVIATLGVADRIDDAPREVDAVARECGADAAALGRVLRLTASHGIFTYEDTVGHTSASRLLRSDHPQSLRSFVRFVGAPLCWQGFAELEYSVRSGDPALNKMDPHGVFGYLAAHRDESVLFNEAMTAKAHGQVAAVLANYDFSRFRTVADIGGGRGHLIRAVVAANHGVTGILFDQPAVVSEVQTIASDRLRLQGGDFFADPLPSADAYTIMEVIHDWEESKAIAILRAIRAAATETSVLLLLENIVPDTPAPHWAKALDLMMMVGPGGRERTRPEYEALLSHAGFRLTRVIETPAISILEARPSSGSHSAM